MHIIHRPSHYSYSPDEIRRCVRPEDVWRYSLNRHTAEAEAKTVSGDFYSSNFNVRKIGRWELRSKYVYVAGSLYDCLCIRRTDELLRFSLCTTLIHRDHEIKQLIETLRGEGSASIFRTDVAEFFETISFSTVISQLEADGFRNTAALRHLKSLNSYLLSNYGFGGLPRGISISSTLADYVMRSVDRSIQTIEGVSYYSRYVDDVCIVHDPGRKSMHRLVSDALPLGLRLNASKTQQLTMPSAGSIEYLGYHIDAEDPKIVKIAQKKLDRVKQRIACALRSYNAQPDYPLLRDRLNFLMCSTKMTMRRRARPVLTGLLHTYRHCTMPELMAQMTELDRFYHRLLRSRSYKLSRDVRAKLSSGQIAELTALSFLRALESRITRYVDQIRIAKIKEAWRYV